jgi:D-alanine-D-alanine ligase
MKKKVIIMFGGVSAEHEVSIITGLQVVESIDRSQFEPYVIYVSKDGELQYLHNLESRTEWKTAPRKKASFGKDKDGGYVSLGGFPEKKVYPYASYFAFHGGTGEAGPWQGVMEALGIPFTSPSMEASVISMNKEITKSLANKFGVKTVNGKSFFSDEIQSNPKDVVGKILADQKFPLIIKPAHFGSSIGIGIAKSETELEMKLLESSRVDREILVEDYIEDKVDYNSSIKSINGEIIISEIERPLTDDEVLSFADKYKKGGKKTGGAGMATLARELPAKLPAGLKERIHQTAKIVYRACRLKGMVRIDFLHSPSTDSLYLNEVNPIPGSMSFYLWEASGELFKDQITELLEESVRANEESKSLVYDYHTDIVEKFIESKRK